MSILLYRLLTLLNDESYESTNFFISKIMLDNYNNLGFMNISELAKLCNVSISKISKFIRTIGFDDFKQFKSEATFKSNRQETSRFPHIIEYISEFGYIDYFSNIKNDIDNLNSYVDANELKRLAKAIHDSTDVAAFGLMHSEHAALQLQSKLAYYGKHIFTQVNDFKQDNYIRYASKDTLIIIFSDSGNYVNTHQISEGHLRKNELINSKSKIALITSNQNELEYPNVDFVIQYKYTSSIHSYSILYSLISDMIAFEYVKLLKAKKELE